MFLSAQAEITKLITKMPVATGIFLAGLITNFRVYSENRKHVKSDAYIQTKA